MDLLRSLRDAFLYLSFALDSLGFDADCDALNATRYVWWIGILDGDEPRGLADRRDEEFKLSIATLRLFSVVLWENSIIGKFA